MLCVCGIDSVRLEYEYVSVAQISNTNNVIVGHLHTSHTGTFTLQYNCSSTLAKSASRERLTELKVCCFAQNRETHATKQQNKVRNANVDNTECIYNCRRQTTLAHYTISLNSFWPLGTSGTSVTKTQTRSILLLFLCFGFDRILWSMVPLSSEF